jgi:hypothetical protein
MAQFFQFETDFIQSLRCIPMSVRLKLDTCGIKLKLNHWNQFTAPEKQQLINLPCNTSSEIKTYQEYLQNLVIEKTSIPAKEITIDPHPPWEDSQNIPSAIIEKAQSFQITITLEKWKKLTPLQRFALIKLSNSNHENANFLPALQEFNLIP